MKPETGAPRRQALLSVYDKTGIVDLARELSALGFSILSSGGTAEAIGRAGIAVTEIARYTGHPEMLEGRVKTLHPKVHGGILADLDSERHRADLLRNGIEPIALVVVNLYPFREVASRPGATLGEIIEMIDIGGPAMVRAAAKNHRHVGVVVDPADYPAVIADLRANGALEPGKRSGLALKAFAHTAAYDAAIRDELQHRFAAETAATRGGIRIAPAVPRGAPPAARFPERFDLSFQLLQTLRYGENPHQRGALYADAQAAPGSIAVARQLQGKELSFNNILDLDSAWRLAAEFRDPVAVVVKHNNPCGVARAATLKEAFARARATDPVSAFGGIVALNRQVDRAAAEELVSLFLECVIAPSYNPEARDILSAKGGLRVMEAGDPAAMFHGFDLRRITGGLLVQDWDIERVDVRGARLATRRAPSVMEREALEFGWRVAKHVKSNAIVLARGSHTVGIGAGQMSRVDSVRLAVSKAQEPTTGTVLASDAFFPFRDGIDEAARAGVTAIIQPGGSLKDEAVIAAAEEHDMAMLFTGVRHFRH
jgi:phosphoribosylaminoimidazolecarboxamide formyltransferase/IMP cyclohydrolase